MEIATIILAGGRGTRIAHLVPDTPKPLALVDGRPFLDWLSLYLMRAGLGRFIISAGYKAEQIDAWMAAFGALHGRSIVMDVVREQEPLGTGGAVLACLHLCEEWLIALNGDSIALFDFASLISLAGRDDLDGAIVGLPVEDTTRYGSLDIADDGLLRGFREKQPGRGMINAGIYLFRKAVLMDRRMPGQISIETDIVPTLIEGGARLRVIDAGAAPFIDIGTPETLAASSAFIARHLRLFDGHA